MTEYTVTDAPPAPPPPGKTTNWKVIIPVAIVVVLCCLCLVVAGVLAYMGTQGNGPLSMLAPATATPTLAPTRTPSPTPEQTLEGVWFINFDWDCTGAYNSVALTFFSDYTYWVEGDSTNTGTWFTSGDYVDFIFDEYPNTHYVGTLDSAGTYMEGTMDNLDSMTGCWYATR